MATPSTQVSSRRRAGKGPTTKWSGCAEQQPVRVTTPDVSLSCSDLLQLLDEIAAPRSAHSADSAFSNSILCQRHQKAPQTQTLLAQHKALSNGTVLASHQLRLQDYEKVGNGIWEHRLSRVLLLPPPLMPPPGFWRSYQSVQCPACDSEDVFRDGQDGKPWQEYFIKHWNKHHAGQKVSNLRRSPRLPYDFEMHDYQGLFFAGLCDWPFCAKYDDPFVGWTMQQAENVRRGHMEEHWRKSNNPRPPSADTIDFDPEKLKADLAARTLQFELTQSMTIAPAPSDLNANGPTPPRASSRASVSSASSVPRRRHATTPRPSSFVRHSRDSLAARSSLAHGQPEIARHSVKLSEIQIQLQMLRDVDWRNPTCPVEGCRLSHLDSYFLSLSVRGTIIAFVQHWNNHWNNHQYMRFDNQSRLQAVVQRVKTDTYRVTAGPEDDVIVAFDNSGITESFPSSRAATPLVHAPGLGSSRPNTQGSTSTRASLLSTSSNDESRSVRTSLIKNPYASYQATTVDPPMTDSRQPSSDDMAAYGLSQASSTTRTTRLKPLASARHLNVNPPRIPPRTSSLKPYTTTKTSTSGYMRTPARPSTAQSNASSTTASSSSGSSSGSSVQSSPPALSYHGQDPGYRPPRGDMRRHQSLAPASTSTNVLSSVQERPNQPHNSQQLFETARQRDPIPKRASYVSLTGSDQQALEAQRAHANNQPTSQALSQVQRRDTTTFPDLGAIAAGSSGPRPSSQPRARPQPIPSPPRQSSPIRDPSPPPPALPPRHRHSPPLVQHQEHRPNSRESSSRSHHQAADDFHPPRERKWTKRYHGGIGGFKGFGGRRDTMQARYRPFQPRRTGLLRNIIGQLFGRKPRDKWI